MQRLTFSTIDMSGEKNNSKSFFFFLSGREGMNEIELHYALGNPSSRLPMI